MSHFRYYLFSIFFFGTTLLSTFAFSKTLPSYCYSKVVKIIQRPVAEGSQSLFDYRYSVSPGSNPDLPVVIFVPGGPGQTSMEMPFGIPTEFTLIRTDPRSMGCNSGAAFPDEGLSSKMIAEDLLALIQDLSPRNYILYGISYGTMVATMVANLAEKSNVTPPTALVLEGTIGRAFKEGEYFKDTLNRWRWLKGSLSPEVQEILDKSEVPLGVSSKQWAAWLSTALIHGVLPSGGDYAIDELMLLDPSQPDSYRQGLQFRVKKMSEPPSPDRVRIYKNIACQEIASDIRDIKYDFDWQNGNLIVTDDRFCDGIPFQKRFDAKQYPVTIPIYYFIGDLDPVTPGFQSDYHFESQKGPRYRINVANGGHNSFATNLADCAGSIWMAIGTNNESLLTEGLSKCAASAILTKSQ